MFSLFSSFDFSFFSFQIFSLLFFLCIFRLKFWNKISNEIFLNKLFWFLDTSFLHIKSKQVSKGMNFFLVGMFFFVFQLNFLSILCFSFPFTSQLGLVLFFSFSFWMCLMLYSVRFSYFNFLSHFIPEGSPLGLSVFLFIIEIVSSLIRPITLTVRLVANILAGHLLMILLSGLVLSHFQFFFLYVGLNLVEFFVSLVQGYIFATMMCLYFSEIH